MNLSWGQLASAFQIQAQFADGYSPLYADIFIHASAVLGKYARGEDLEFDETALIRLLENGFKDRYFGELIVEATLLLAAAIHIAVLAEASEAAPISRFFATVGGSYEPDFDRNVLFQVLGGYAFRG